MFPTKTSRVAAALTPTLFMAGGEFALTSIVVLYLCRHNLVAYKYLRGMKAIYQMLVLKLGLFNDIHI
jgi:hypothetical protein